MHGLGSSFHRNRRNFHVFHAIRTPRLLDRFLARPPAKGNGPQELFLPYRSELFPIPAPIPVSLSRGPPEKVPQRYRILSIELSPRDQKRGSRRVHSQSLPRFPGLFLQRGPEIARSGGSYSPPEGGPEAANRTGRRKSRRPAGRNSESEASADLVHSVRMRTQTFGTRSPRVDRPGVFPRANPDSPGEGLEGQNRHFPPVLADHNRGIH